MTETDWLLIFVGATQLGVGWCLGVLYMVQRTKRWPKPTRLVVDGNAIIDAINEGISAGRKGSAR